jgi:hypothetical protein
MSDAPTPAEQTTMDDIRQMIDTLLQRRGKPILDYIRKRDGESAYQLGLMLDEMARALDINSPSLPHVPIKPWLPTRADAAASKESIVINDCPNCGGTHFGSRACPLLPEEQERVAREAAAWKAVDAAASRATKENHNETTSRDRSVGTQETAAPMEEAVAHRAESEGVGRADQAPSVLRGVAASRAQPETPAPYVNQPCQKPMSGGGRCWLPVHHNGPCSSTTKESETTNVQREVVGVSGGAVGLNRPSGDGLNPSDRPEILRVAVDAKPLASRAPSPQDAETPCPAYKDGKHWYGNRQVIGRDGWRCNCGDFQPITAPAAVVPDPLTGWQPMETAPKDYDTVCFWWMVPKSPEESYTNTSGEPIVSNHKGYRHYGKRNTWGALSKPTYWMPDFAAPPGEAALRRAAGEKP